MKRKVFKLHYCHQFALDTWCYTNVLIFFETLMESARSLISRQQRHKHRRLSSSPSVMLLLAVTSRLQTLINYSNIFPDTLFGHHNEHTIVYIHSTQLNLLATITEKPEFSNFIWRIWLKFCIQACCAYIVLSVTTSKPSAMAKCYNSTFGTSLLHTDATSESMQ